MASPPAVLKRRRSTPRVWSKYQVLERHKDIPFHQIKELKAGSRCSAAASHPDAVRTTQSFANINYLFQREFLMELCSGVSILKNLQPQLSDSANCFISRFRFLGFKLTTFDQHKPAFRLL